MKEMNIKAFAKVNLTLDVKGVRPDGYHDVETVMQAISLYDDVIVRWFRRDWPNIEIQIECNKVYVPKDERNLAHKAASLMIEKFGSQKLGGDPCGGKIEIVINKQIPVSAGLAGGSGDAAAVITALNNMWRLNLSVGKLCSIGAEIGADVPFCLLVQNRRASCALCTGTGANVKPISSRFKTALVLVKPPFGVSTKEVYGGIDECVITQRPDSLAMMAALQEGYSNRVYAGMANVLEEYTLKKFKDVDKLKKTMEAELSAKKVMMTGSGPTIYALFNNVKDAKFACRTMRDKGCEAYWATTL